jgi:hypothetical protein
MEEEPAEAAGLPGTAEAPTAADAEAGGALVKCHRCQQERPYSEYDVMGDGTTAPQLSPFCRVCMFDEQLRTQIQELLAAQVVESLPEEQGHGLGPAAGVSGDGAHDPHARQEHVHDAHVHSSIAGEQTEQQVGGAHAAQQGSAAAAHEAPTPAHALMAQDGSQLSQLHHGHDPNDQGAALPPDSAAAAAAAAAGHLLPQLASEEHAAHHAAAMAAAAAAVAAAQQQLDPHGHAQLDPAHAAAHAQQLGLDPHAAAAAAAATAAAMAAAAAAAAAAAQDPNAAQLDPAAMHHHIHAAAMHAAAMQLDPAMAAAAFDPQHFGQLLHDGGMALGPEAYAAFYQQHQVAAAAAAAAGGMLAHAAQAPGVLGEEGDTMHKVCTKCKLEKTLHEFPELKGKKRGRAAQCK